MSLKNAAAQLAAHGRGNDSNLVHMTDSELNTLQGLAAAHGGQITINPDTGLPEAGFLESILPFAAGVFLGPAGLGLSALQSGLLVGGVSALASKDLSKGLMAGLGAYGGAGLLGSVTGAGEAALQAAGSQAAVPGMTVVDTAAMQPLQSSFALDAPASGLTQSLSSSPTYSLTGASPYSMTGQGAALAPKPTFALGDMPKTITAQPQVTLPTKTIGGAAEVVDKSAYGFGDKLSAGAKAVWNDPAKFMTKDNLKYGLAAAAPIMMAAPEQEEYKPDTERYTYAYNPGRVENPEEGYTGPYSGERTWFKPSYTRVMAEGGLAGYADGGEVDNEIIEYEYDPLTRTYKKKATPVAASPVAPITGSTASSSGASSETNPLSPQQEAYLSWEADTAEGNVARDNRMQNISNLISLGVPGLGIVNALQGKPTPLPSLSAIFGTPAAYANYQARQASSPYAGLTPGSAAWSQAVNEQAASRMARQEGVGDSGGGDYGGGDNSNRSDPSAVGSMADTAGDKRGGRIGDKKHHRTPMRQGLGSAAEKGRFLEGPGDGVSDSIPATINGTQPARLADGEFVIPARIVSELGNGSSKAGARKLYAMMDRIQRGRRKTTGKGRVAVDSKADKHLPA